MNREMNEFITTAIFCGILLFGVTTAILEYWTIGEFMVMFSIFCIIYQWVRNWMKKTSKKPWTPPLRIAFGCQARVGKDTACDFLSEKYGGQVHRFSETLYNILYMTQEILGFDQKKDRKFLQYIGTDWAREQDPDVWVRCLFESIESIPDENVFISDLRFPNEMERLKEEGFVCVRILRDVNETSNHASEVGLLNAEFDFVIENNGTLEEFYEKLDTLVTWIRLGKFPNHPIAVPDSNSCASGVQII